MRSDRAPALIANSRRRQRARADERRGDLARQIDFVLRLRLHADGTPGAVGTCWLAKSPLGLQDAIGVCVARLVVVGSRDGSTGVAVGATIAPLERPRATRSIAAVIGRKGTCRGARDVFAG